MKKKVCNLYIDDVSPDEALHFAALCAENAAAERRIFRICTVNAGIAYSCIYDRALADAVNSAELVVADGAGTVLGSRAAGNAIRGGKVAGCELAIRMLSLPGLRFFFLGGAPGVAEEAAGNAQRDYGTNICGMCDGYFSRPGDNSRICEMITRAAPDVVFVCLGSPEQEMWVCENAVLLPPALYIGLGGTLDLLAGRAKRAPRFFVAAGLEWFWRILREPRRIKNILCIPKYLFLCGRSRKENKKIHRG